MRACSASAPRRSAESATGHGYDQSLRAVGGTCGLCVGLAVSQHGQPRRCLLQGTRAWLANLGELVGARVIERIYPEAVAEIRDLEDDGFLVQAA